MSEKLIDTIKSVFGILIMGVIAAIVISIAIKSLITETYSSDNIKIGEEYLKDMGGGAIYKMVFISETEYIFSKAAGDIYEEALMTINYGESAKNYIGPIYNVYRPSSLFGIRIYFNALNVWIINTSIVSKSGNTENTYFEDEGTTFEDMVFIVKSNSIKIGGIEYKLMDY